MLGSTFLFLFSVLGTFLLLLNGFCAGEYVFVIIKGISVLGSTFLFLLKGFCAGEYVFVIIKVVSVLGSTFLLLLKGFLCWGVRFCYY